MSSRWGERAPAENGLRVCATIALCVAFAALVIWALELRALGVITVRGPADYARRSAAIHVLCRGQEHYVDCTERWADAYEFDLAAPDEATVIKWWRQGAECRLQGFDLYDENTGRCIPANARPGYNNDGS